jgi:hypothetical protein
LDGAWRTVQGGWWSGERAGARTQDQRLKRAMLYQLSYALELSSNVAQPHLSQYACTHEVDLCHSKHSFSKSERKYNVSDALQLSWQS